MHQSSYTSYDAELEWVGVESQIRLHLGDNEEAKWEEVKGLHDLIKDKDRQS